MHLCTGNIFIETLCSFCRKSFRSRCQFRSLLERTIVHGVLSLELSWELDWTEQNRWIKRVESFLSLLFGIFHPRFISLQTHYKLSGSNEKPIPTLFMYEIQEWNGMSVDQERGWRKRGQRHHCHHEGGGVLSAPLSNGCHTIIIIRAITRSHDDMTEKKERGFEEVDRRTDRQNSLSVSLSPKSLYSLCILSVGALSTAFNKREIA